MSEFKKIKGRISALSPMTSSNGKTYYKIQITVDGMQYPIKGITWDNALAYRGDQVLDIAYTEQVSTQTNPHNGKPYVNKTFYLPNHVRKDGTTGQQPQTQKSDGLAMKVSLLEKRIEALEGLLANKSQTRQGDNFPCDENLEPVPDQEIPF